MAETQDDVHDSAETVKGEHEAAQDVHTARHVHHNEESEAESDSETSAAGAKPAATNSRWVWLVQQKRWTIPAGVVLLVLLLTAIPFTRYTLAGTVLRRSFSIVVTDSQTGKPVSSASVALGGKKATTDNQGKVYIRAKVGTNRLIIEKTYYKSSTASVLVPIGKQRQPEQLQLVATGRQVPITVVNKLTGKPIENAVVSALKTQAKTDKKGQVTLVLPADASNVPLTIALDGYNTLTGAKVKVTAQVDPVNTFQVTPSGKLYFLSNLSGKVDVVKTDLDGANRQMVLAGTGSEDPTNTSLLASTDWKYLALLSKRDGGDNAKLFLIDTSNDQLTTMDEGSAAFKLAGWDNHHFVYEVDRLGMALWQPKQQAIKSFDATSKNLVTLDETTATGSSNADYLKENYGNVFVLTNGVVYTKGWQAGHGYNDWNADPGKQATLNIVQPDNSGKKTVQSFSYTPGTQTADINIQARSYEANGLYLQFINGQADTFYTYEDGAIAQNKTLTNESFYQAYSTYLTSPSGKLTFWNEPRDGKNALFVGDSNGEHGKQIAASSTYQVYGWYTDNYLLVSKDASELYVMPASGIVSDATALKISNYYRPPVSYYGYGKGYGGL